MRLSVSVANLATSNLFVRSVPQAVCGLQLSEAPLLLPEMCCLAVGRFIATVTVCDFSVNF